MVVADLHVHTTNSDGRLALADLPARASDAGLEAVAVTDHDRPHPGLDAPVVERDGVTVVHGIELRVDAGDQRVDLLGLGLDPTPDLRDCCVRLQRDRVARGRAIVECLEARLDVTLDVPLERGLGRPDIARAVAEATDYDVDAVFAEWIGDGRPCYRPRDVPTFDRGRALLAESSALVALAHPLRYDDPAAALARCADLDAVERWYPYDGDPDPTPVERAIDRHDLLAVGGSDAHDEVLGRTGLDEAGWGRVRGRLG